MGTLEALLVTPTATATVQLGSAVFDLVYVPLRTAVFLGVHGRCSPASSFEPSGILPALAVLLAFIPFVWGLGIAGAAAILTFKRGAGAIGLGALLLGFTSGAFFPLDLLPAWLAAAGRVQPARDRDRRAADALLAGTGWEGVSRDVLVLISMSTLTLIAGSVLFKLALDRERRRGTLGLY